MMISNYILELQAFTNSLNVNEVLLGRNKSVVDFLNGINFYNPWNCEICIRRKRHIFYFLGIFNVF